jgi:hypothetical protein
VLVPGVAFKKTFSYAGFEMQPKSYKNPLIALLNIELELKKEKENAEMRIDNVKEYQVHRAEDRALPGWWALGTHRGRDRDAGHCGCGMGDSLREVGEDSRIWCQDCVEQAAHWRRGDAVVCRPVRPRSDTAQQSVQLGGGGPGRGGWLVMQERVSLAIGRGAHDLRCPQ